MGELRHRLRDFLERADLACLIGTLPTLDFAHAPSPRMRGCDRFGECPEKWRSDEPPGFVGTLAVSISFGSCFRCCHWHREQRLVGAGPRHWSLHGAGFCKPSSRASTGLATTEAQAVQQSISEQRRFGETAGGSIAPMMVRRPPRLPRPRSPPSSRRSRSLASNCSVAQCSLGGVSLAAILGVLMYLVSAG